MIKNCEGIPYPVYEAGFVKECKSVENAVPKNSVYELTIELKESKIEPAAGQFNLIVYLDAQLVFLMQKKLTEKLF